MYFDPFFNKSEASFGLFHSKTVNSFIYLCRWWEFGVFGSNKCWQDPGGRTADAEARTGDPYQGSTYSTLHLSGSGESQLSAGEEPEEGFIHWLRFSNMDSDWLTAQPATHRPC